MSQQEIIDLAIASYIKTNDNNAKQYLKLRQEALEVTQQVHKEVTNSGSISLETALRLEKLKFENAKTSLTYKAYIDNISTNLEMDGVSGGRISAKLDQKYEELCEKKKVGEEWTEQLRKEHKPVVEKMRHLASKFETGVSARSRRSGPEDRIFTNRGSEPDENEILLDFASTVFTREELEEQLKDVESKLASLRTVDEISNETGSVGGPVQEAAPSINLNKYLGELLQSGRAYHRLDDSSYQFDNTKISFADLGTPGATISDYEMAIDSLTKEIQGLVARGTEAKERWISNAQKIETIQAMLQEDMDIDG